MNKLDLKNKTKAKRYAVEDFDGVFVTLPYSLTKKVIALGEDWSRLTDLYLLEAVIDESGSPLFEEADLDEVDQTFVDAVTRTVAKARHRQVPDIDSLKKS